MLLFVLSILYTFLSVCFIVIANRVTLIGLNYNIYNISNSLDDIGKKVEAHINLLAQKFESAYEQSVYEATNTTSSFFYYLRKQLINPQIESNEEAYKCFPLSELNLPSLLKHEIGSNKIYVCMIYKYYNFKRIEKEFNINEAIKRTMQNTTDKNQAHYPWDIKIILIDGSRFPKDSENQLKAKYCHNCQGPDIFINGTKTENASCMQGHQRYVLKLDFTQLDKKLLLLNPIIENSANGELLISSTRPVLTEQARKMENISFI